jgi:hypothetical protein
VTEKPITGTSLAATVAWRTFFAVSLFALALTLYLREVHDRNAAHQFNIQNYNSCLVRNAATVSAVERERAIASLQAASDDPTRRAEAPIHTQSAKALARSVVNCESAHGGKAP